jgi:xylose isomerase
MAGLNMLHAVAQAWEAGKLFHIDLNDQLPGRYDQHFRFGSANPRAAFWLVKFLEDVGYDGPRHFDAHAYRTEDDEGVKDFARGCMRTYLVLKEKAAQWNADPEIAALAAEIGAAVPPSGAVDTAALRTRTFDRARLAAVRLPYERLDQLTVDLLLGIREP